MLVFWEGRGGEGRGGEGRGGEGRGGEGRGGEGRGGGGGEGSVKFYQSPAISAEVVHATEFKESAIPDSNLHAHTCTLT